MKTERKDVQNLEQVARDWGINYQVFKIKIHLIDLIKNHCITHQISQRKLAALVPGLTQDRVSRIFSSQVGHMTLDKLVEILFALKIRVTMKVARAA